MPLQKILYAAETVLGFFGFNRTVYENPMNNRKKEKKWYDELLEERKKDIKQK
jgi:hypothetical protein